MSAPRKGYRIYGYDGERRTVTSDWIEASTDDDAIVEAAARGFTKSELWEGERLIAQLKDEHRAA